MTSPVGLRILSSPATYGIVFLAYAASSVTWSVSESNWPALFLLSLVIAFVLGTLLRTMKIVWIAAMILIVPSILLIPLQSIHTVGWAHEIIPFDLDVRYGLFGNSNFLGCALALALVAALGYRQWWFIPFAGAGLWLSQSRGALIAAAVGMFLYLFRRYRVSSIVVGSMAVVVVLHFSQGRPDDSIWVRVGLWQDTINHLTVFGSGWGSFWDSYGTWPRHTNTSMVLARPLHAYNDFLEIIFELGIGAVFLWAFLILALEKVDEATWLIVVTFAVASLSFYPLFLVPLGHLLAAQLGSISSVRDVLWTNQKETRYALST